MDVKHGSKSLTKWKELGAFPFTDLYEIDDLEIVRIEDQMAIYIGSHYNGVKHGIGK